MFSFILGSWLGIHNYTHMDQSALKEVYSPGILNVKLKPATASRTVRNEMEYEAWPFKALLTAYVCILPEE